MSKRKKARKAKDVSYTEVRVICDDQLQLLDKVEALMKNPRLNMRQKRVVALYQSDVEGLRQVLNSLRMAEDEPRDRMDVSERVMWSIDAYTHQKNLMKMLDLLELTFN